MRLAPLSLPLSTMSHSYKEQVTWTCDMFSREKGLNVACTFNSFLRFSCDSVENPSSCVQPRPYTIWPNLKEAQRSWTLSIDVCRLWSPKAGCNKITTFINPTKLGQNYRFIFYRLSVDISWQSNIQFDSSWPQDKHIIILINRLERCLKRKFYIELPHSSFVVEVE